MYKNRTSEITAQQAQNLQQGERNSAAVFICGCQQLYTHRIYSQQKKKKSQEKIPRTQHPTFSSSNFLCPCKSFSRFPPLFQKEYVGPTLYRRSAQDTIISSIAYLGNQVKGRQESKILHSFLKRAERYHLIW